MQNNLLHSRSSSIDDKKIFGFWTYLMSDCILFATLFATYAVLVSNTAGGPSGKDIFSLKFVFFETVILLLSSLTCGLSVIYAKNKIKSFVYLWLLMTLLLGISFIGMESYEFYHLIAKGYVPSKSSFLSSFFLLVGTHAIHVTTGIFWILLLISHITKNGLNRNNNTRLICFSLFWHFLDLIWICVFSLVYLIGTI
ncbi:cytochrome o ubiquinol oxidase subunit III [Candidatus Tachikawaea gelatinosa]|uniref:Cytochrome bo(3) ubiquinol oxidase subunit 3 n=1 Tax=Candidatus Tachikawaea gelatinosa TaxID=1410383 RepID=A0A090AK66_9ENTR|nr:cytochrome o ubiquinol oxidase subunit III [Candidatus Tachikawaea gelatinosa]BAP58823.1 cytochrome o ubiquinol oxidase subunit III [Candidatus Tachikawaea gelatinosa]